MQIKDKVLVIQANHIIEARYKLSLEEQRLMKILISMIDPKDEDTKIYRINAVDIAQLFGITEDHIYNTLKQVTSGLLKKVLFIKRGNGELQVSWLSSAEYIKGGMVDLEISQKLRPYLLQLKQHFTKYQLRQITKLKSGFSIRIYELCKSYEYKGGFTMEVDCLKNMLGIENNYKLYGDFKRYVLSAARKEINATTDIAIEFHEIKERKKVAAIEFHVESKVEAIDPPPEIIDASRAGLGKQGDAPFEQLIRLGVATGTAEKITRDYDADRIAQGIAYVESKQQEGKIKNPAGFLIEAIKSGYRDPQAEERARREARRQAKDRQEKQAKATEEKQKQAKARAVDRFLAALDPAGLAALQAEFLGLNRDNLALAHSFNKGGMGAPLVDGCFRDFIAKHKLQGEATG